MLGREAEIDVAGSFLNEELIYLPHGWIGCEGKLEGKVEGRLEGKVAALLAFLAARGIAVSAQAHARIEACSDVPTLDRWITRAATASSAEEAMDLTAKNA